MTTAEAHLAPGRELLDDPRADPALVRASLRNIARANRWFGGVAAARFGVGRLLDRRPDRPGAVSSGHRDRVTLLDVGTGMGDLPAALGSWLAGRGVAATCFAVERNPTAARMAAEGGLATAVGDGLRLPFGGRSVDIVLLSQIAHHLAPPAILELCREATRVARIGVVLADLARSRLAQIGFFVASRALRFDPATCADGVTSVKRGFRVGDLAGLLAQGGIAAHCVARPGWRVVATWGVLP
ncbi:MAG: methyltransferase domain-containing protein [Gemmatimonadetes bacterium]|nr:methyltransferase domain-containing protein [Gemmatimonadota bacterium]